MANPKLVSRLNELLAERGISGKQLAADAGVTERAVSVLRRDAFQLLDRDTIARLCVTLQVTPGELFSIQE